MADEPNPPIPSVIAAPPTAPMPLTAAQAPATTSWPAIVGTVAIVFAALGLLFTGFALAGMFADWGRPPAETRAVAERYRIPMLVSYVTGGIAEVLQIVGAIGLLLRRRWGVRLLWIWASAQIFITLIGALLGYLSFEAMERANAIPGPFAFTKLFTLLSIVLALLWGWSLPIFLFIWLSRHQTREEVETWK